MWIRLSGILFVIALLTFSCNKEPNIWNREEGLDLDTATLLFAANYVSNIDTQVTLEIDIVTLNGLNSETNYANQFYYDSVRSYANHTFNLSSVTINKYSSTPYTTVLLIDENNPGWYTRERVGFYMRRYFESISNSSITMAGLASFKDDYSKSTKFYSEKSLDYLNNSWEFNTNTFYKITEFSEYTNSMHTDITLEYVITKIDETMDHLISLDDKQGDLSITFLSEGNFIDGQGSKVLIDNLIAKALSNQIRINLIGFDYDFNTSIRRLAIETGGFIGSNEVNYQSVTPTYDESKKLSNKGVILENLDLLLSRNVTSHRCQLVVNIDAGQGAFIAGTSESIQVNYNSQLYTIEFSIP